MATKRGSRLVYSTESGRRCPTCGWPADDCRCSSRLEEAVPSRITARLRIERAGRGGKTVTVVDSLPRNRSFLAELARELKRAAGCGGTAGEGRVELQGDRREEIRARLVAKGWIVKG